MLSNQQMFGNVVNSLEFSTEQMTSAHDFGCIGTMNQASPMLLFVFAFTVITIMRVFFYEYL